MNKIVKNNIEKDIQKQLKDVPESSGIAGPQKGITSKLVQSRLEYAAGLRLRNNFTYYTILKMVNAKAEEKGWGIVSLSYLQKELPKYIVGNLDKTNEQKRIDNELARQEMIQSLYADIENVNTIILSKTEIKKTITKPDGTKVETVTPKVPSFGQKGYLYSIIDNKKSLIAKLEGWEKTNVFVQNNNITKNEITLNEQARKEYSDPNLANTITYLEKLFLGVGTESEDGGGHDSDRNVVEGITVEPNKPEVENA